ncbi:S1C family serine protease [Sporosarcina sp. JAI121]|uniref:S1C family serine protease n=1 Tax=Sporosarcina sp. JAI121 TaxID=2723064 RepID=UPI0015CC8450|nr:serine protease [Sporosarcina sp. JAI121]NYF24838.1 S1-C subfamily serine protease [Sporosarcina sp. JAI121]
MKSTEKQQTDLLNEDYVDEIDDDELQVLVLEAQREALSEENPDKSSRKTKRPFPKWVFWLTSIMLVFNTFAVIFEIYSIPAIDFLKTSARLSSQKDIASYKKSVVVIVTEDSKGTGFSISSDGTILTNYHVIEGYDTVTVKFPDEGLITATVVHTFPSIDLAVLETNGENLPYLQLAEQTSYVDDEPIYFIGNPLSFTGIANEGMIIGDILLSGWEEPVVMINAPVFKGNSGSPVVNRKGQVIGIVFATLKHEAYGEVGLFVPIDEYHNRQ